MDDDEFLIRMTPFIIIGGILAVVGALLELFCV